MSRNDLLSRPALFRCLSCLLIAVAVFGVAACQPTSDSGSTDLSTEPAAPEPLTVYSGRNESLIGPLFDRFEETTGVEVKVRYGSTAELAATLLEEGKNSPADLFVSQDAAALGAVTGAGLLKVLPTETVSRVAGRFSDRDGHWVGLSGRARSIVYNTEAISPEELPKSLEEVADPKYSGRFGIAPANGSFQAHMAVYRVAAGEEALADLLSGLAANDPQRYPKNSAIVEAVVNGEVDFGLVNHYYLLRALAESPDAPGANVFQTEGPASGFVNVAGVGVLSERPEAVALVNFLLGDEAQRYFAEQTFEYPLVDGVERAGQLIPLDELSTPDIDFAEVSAVYESTLEAIRESGLLP